MALKLAGRRCLVVGGGAIAESKIDSLTRCGARVRVVAPEATEKIRAAARAGEIQWRKRRYRTQDLDHVFLVVAATPSAQLHERIFRQAQAAGVLCNAVDEPERCDFYYPAVVRRGPLQIAISTGGRSPSLAQRLRRELERRFPPEYRIWTEELGRSRAAVLSSGTPAQERKQLLKRLSSAASFAAFRRRVKTKGAQEGRK